MKEIQKEMLIKNGKFYNTEKAILISQHPSDGEMYKHYKSQTGVFFRTKTNIDSSGEERGLEGIIDEISFSYVRDIYQHIKVSTVGFTKGKNVTSIEELTKIEEV